MDGNHRDPTRTQHEPLHKTLILSPPLVSFEVGVGPKFGPVPLTCFGVCTAWLLELTSWCLAADEIIKKNVLDFGFAGWMADFGEYLPVDGVYSDGSDPLCMHNEYPVL